MPASEHKAVQTDTYDGRKFITFKVASNGTARYRKVYLQTKNGLTARRRGRAIEELEDVEETRAIIAYLASSRSPEEEKRRLAEVNGNQPVIPAMTFGEARVELESVVCDFGDYARGEIVDFTNDKHVRALAKKDLVKFVDHVIGKTRGRSNKTVRDHLSPIRAVIECARVRMDDDVFPEAIDNWLRIIDREKRRRPYKSPRRNREPIPVDTFKALLSKADEWAELDWEAYAASLPVPNGQDRRRTALAINRNKQKSQYLKRVGLATHSMLCLAANVGAQPIDFTRLLWSELILDGDLPLYQEGRSKPSHLLGSEVPRCCPLLTETVRSLSRWREWQAAELTKVAARAAGKSGTLGEPTDVPKAVHVFTYADGRAMNQKTSDQVSAYFGSLRKAVGVTEWQLRHCRNIGSTVRRNAGLPADMANAWLGHSARETNKFYTGEAGEDYLLPLVQEIGRVYFAETGDGAARRKQGRRSRART